MKNGYFTTYNYKKIAKYIFKPESLHSKKKWCNVNVIIHLDILKKNSVTL